MPWSAVVGGLRCCLCLRNQVFSANPLSSDFDLVQLSSSVPGGLSVHPACLRAASGLGGGGCCDHTAEQVVAEVGRCSGRTCSYCGRRGASVDCAAAGGGGGGGNHGCPAALHLPCLILHGKLGRRKDRQHLCRDHAIDLKRKEKEAAAVQATITGVRSRSTSHAAKRKKAVRLKRKKWRRLSKKAAPPKQRLSRSDPEEVTSRPAETHLKLLPSPPPPLLRLALNHSPDKRSSVVCVASSCRCPFGNTFSDAAFWPLTHCHRCSEVSAHRFCVRGKARRWTCKACCGLGTDMGRRRRRGTNPQALNPKLDSDRRKPNRVGLVRPRIRVKKMAAAGMNGDGEQRSSSDMLTSMKMSFCRDLDLRLVQNGDVDNAGSGSGSGSGGSCKRRSDRSPLSLRQREAPFPDKDPASASTSALSRVLPTSSSSARAATGKENQYRTRKDALGGLSRSRKRDSSGKKDEEWLLKNDLSKAPELSSQIGDRGKESNKKPLPKGWVWIEEEVAPPAAAATGRSCLAVPGTRVESANGIESSVKLTRSSSFTPKAEASPPAWRLSATATPSKRQQSKSSSGSSSPAKKFVDNSVAVDHGVLVRKLDEAFDSEAARAEPAAKRHKKSRESPVPKKEAGSAAAPRMYHGRKERPVKKVSVGFTPIEERVIHHVRTTLPIEHGEPEAEEDYDWLVGNSDRMIDDFLDLNEGEKGFFKLWNAHLHRHPCYGDEMMMRILALFVDECGECVARERLYRNFILHLSNLCDFDVLNEEAVEHFAAQMRRKCREVLVEEKKKKKGINISQNCDDSDSNDSKFNGGKRRRRGRGRGRGKPRHYIEMKSDTASTVKKESAATTPSPRRSVTRQAGGGGERGGLLQKEGETLMISQPVAVGRASIKSLREIMMSKRMSRSPESSTSPSRRSSERSMRLYLSESEDELEEAADTADTAAMPTRSGRRRRRRTKEQKRVMPRREELTAATAATAVAAVARLNSSASVSYAGDKTVERISDNSAVTSGLCFAGTRRSAFASNVVRYQGRAVRKRKGRRKGDASAASCSSPSASSSSSPESTHPASESAKRRPEGRRGRPPRQRQEDPAAAATVAAAASAVVSPSGRKRKAKDPAAPSRSSLPLYLTSPEKPVRRPGRRSGPF